MDLIQFFISISEKYGVLGVFVGATLESIGVPFANSVMIFGSGALISTGKASYVEIVIAGALGNVIGSGIAYGIGYILGNKVRKWRHGDLFKGEKILNSFIEKYGTIGVFVAQLYGTARTFVSIPAGMMRMNFKKFIVYTGLGGLAFSILVTAFSFVVRDAYYKYVFPVLGLSFGSAAILLIIAGLVIHYSIAKGEKIKNYLKNVFK